MAHPKQNAVQRRYNFRCGYCGVSEVDAGGELTVDHFCPRVMGGGDEDENLVYACFRCNLYKGDFFPNAGDREQGHRVLHPLQDDLSAHLTEDAATLHLIPLTETGRFHIALLRLNRPALIAHRERRHLIILRQAERTLLTAQISHMRQLLEAQQQYIGLLESSDEQNPGDAPG